MKFEDWLNERDLEKSSIKKYFGAIKGVLSQWAVEAHLIDSNLLEITSQSKFNVINQKLQELNLFKERNSVGNNMYSRSLNLYSEYLGGGVIQTIEEDIEEIFLNQNIETTEKLQLINARVGQGQFRKTLLIFWQCCAVTGSETSSMLMASHIKPWSKSNNFERLDKFNGLLLSPNLDRAFDQGLISFSENGKIEISHLFTNYETLGINAEMFIRLQPEHQNYMKFHRENVYKKT